MCVCGWVGTTCVFYYVCVQVRKTSKIVRAIAILDHPLPGTHDADSCQIILPQRQVRV